MVEQAPGDHRASYWTVERKDKIDLNFNLISLL